MRISKWGNCLAVRLPKTLVDELDLKVGDQIDIVDATRVRLALERSDRRLRALERMRSRQWTLPADYRFSRDEANQR